MNNLQAVIQIIQAVASLLPVILQAVSAVEAALPQKGVGTQKLEMVKGWIQQAISAQQTATVAFDALWPAIQSTITTIVAVKNAAGEFRK